MAGGRPAKRARGAAGADAAAAAAALKAEQEQQEAAAGSDDAGNAASDEEEQAPPAGMSALEWQRQQQMARNRARLAALELPRLASELAPASKPRKSSVQHKGVARKRLTEVLPRRESSRRVRGMAAEGGEVHSERQGQVVVIAGETIRRYGDGGMSEEQVPQDRHPQGELQFESSNASAATDEAFIQLLAHAAAAANSGAERGGKAGSGGSGGKGGSGSKAKGAAAAAASTQPLGVAGMKRLSLAEEDVAKVTKDATTHLAFHPASDTLLVACADKKGGIGLWHVNEGSWELPAAARRAQPILRRPAPDDTAAAEEGEGAKPAAVSGAAVSVDSAGGEVAGGEDADAAAAFDGVLALQPQHYQYVSGLRWAGGSGRGASLFTCAYDGSLRRLDVERGVSELIVSSEEDEYSAMDVTADGRTALLGDNEGAIRLVDVRAPAATALGAAHTLHARKLNTISIDPGQEQLFATASTDTTVSVWDLRALGAAGSKAKLKPLATAQHSKGCQGAAFAPDGSRRIVSTSFEDTLKVWESASKSGQLTPSLTIRHDNNTGRWVLPFRACWNAAADGVIVGNMKRAVDIFDATTGALAAQLSSGAMTAIPSRNAVHPVLPVLAAATNSGRIHIYRC